MQRRLIRKRVSWNGFVAYLDNLPRAMPGVYKITDTVNNKAYVGASLDVKRRLSDHSYMVKSGRKEFAITKAIMENGIGSFLIEPLYYIPYIPYATKEALGEAEKTLILIFETHKFGYNSVIGPSAGSVWPESLREKRAATFAKPEVQDKRRKAMLEAQSRPEVIEASRSAKANPEYRAQQQQKSVLAWADAELRAEQSERLRTYLSVPENREKRVEQVLSVQGQATEAAAQVVKGSIWINDGAHNQRVPKSMIIPIGWKTGRATNGVKFGPKSKEHVV